MVISRINAEHICMTVVHFSLQFSSAYHAYVSPFTLYPSLNHFSDPSSSSPFLYNFAHSSSTLSSEPTHIQQLDLRPLCQLAGINPQQHLCSYEFDDGVCRDERCRDIHRRDLDPDGELSFSQPHLYRTRQIIFCLTSVASIR